MIQQTAQRVIMVRPIGFHSNNETAADNEFQNANDQSLGIIEKEACREFDMLVDQLRQAEIHVDVLTPLQPQNTPDAVFPNNWFSIGQSGLLTIFPMAHNSRRLEVRPGFEQELVAMGIHVQSIRDIRANASDNQYLEGTGSIVFDHPNRIAYMARSIRSNELLAQSYCRDIDYELVAFNTDPLRSHAIYHTNVLLSILSDQIVVCKDVISRHDEMRVMESLQKSGRQIIPIEHTQMLSFACNILEVRNRRNQKCIVMSQTAKNALNKDQLAQLTHDSSLIVSGLSTIETYGGGSARCMLAEVFG
jgi:hypothetical protein